MKHVITLVLVSAVVLPGSAGWAQRPPGGRAADLAVISPPMPRVGSDGRVLGPADTSALVEMLVKSGEEFEDVTAAVSAGKLEFARVRALLIGSGALAGDGGRIADVLTDGRKLVAGFVEAGGVLVVFTHPDDPSVFTFLPDGMSAQMTAESHDKRFCPIPEHPLITGRHRLSPRDLGRGRGTLYPGWCYGAYHGLVPVVAYDQRGRYPIILEGSAGRGRVILIHLSPDRAFLTGSADEKVSATLLVENVLSYVRRILAGGAPQVKPAARVLHGVVFEDVNADGRKDPDEKTLPDVEVSDGESSSTVTDAQGRYALTLDAYSEFAWVGVDFARYRSPLWRRIDPTSAALDIGAVGREKPLGPTPRVVYLVDVGGMVNPADPADPELTALLDEISRLEPKPDLLVLCGDSRACGLRGATLRKSAPAFEVIHAFVPSDEAEDVVAERDAFRNVLGPSPRKLRLGSRTFEVHAREVLEWPRPGGGSPSFRKRGLKSPPGFFVVDLVPGAEHVPGFRPAGFTTFLHASHPGLEALIPPGPLAVSFVLGDTSLGDDTPVKIEMAHIRHREGRLELVELELPEYELVSHGVFTRSAAFRKPVVLEPGFYVMRFAAGPPRTSWSRNVSFVVPKDAPPPATFGNPWPGPGGGSARTAEALDNVAPPFYLASVVNVGGRGLCGSPVVLSGLVLVPVGPKLSGVPAAVPAEQPNVMAMHFPFCRHEQGLFEFRGTDIRLSTAQEPSRTFVFEFAGVPPSPATTHLLVGGELLCVVDAKGAAWGFVRTRGAEVKDDAYDPKAAAEGLKWRSDVAPGCRQAVATDAELFTGNECLEIAGGNLRWKLEKYTLRDHSVALSGKQLVITGLIAGATSLRQVVLAVERETGKFVWEKDLAEVHPADDVMTAAPAVARGAVFVGSADGVFRALALATGDELWQFKTEASVIPLSAGPGPRTGRISSGAVVSDRTVFFGAADGSIYALDRRKGTLLWSCNVGLPVVASPALSGNTLYVADWDGNLYTFVSLADKKSP